MKTFKEHITEGKMKELHGYIEDGLSAKEIAKIMKLDVKTIEKLMSEATQYSKKGTKKFHTKTSPKSWAYYIVDKLRLKISGDEVRLMTLGGVPNNLGNIGFNMKPEGSDASIRKIILDANKKHKGDMKKVAKEISSKINLKVEVMGTMSEAINKLSEDTNVKESLKDYFAQQVKDQEDAKKLSKSQLAKLKKEYAKVDKIDPTTSAYKRMKNKLTSLPTVVLQQIVDAEIKFLRVDAASIIKGRKT